MMLTEDLLRPWLESPQQAAILVDFDGTLAPIVADHDKAVPLAEAPALLARLAERFALVAVISGRPIDYLARHLAGAGATRLVGLYGLERAKAGTGEVERVAAAEPWEGPLWEAADAAEAAAPEGVVVERKGLAVTLHFRSAPHLEGWAAQFATECARRSGLVVHGGKKSFELRPPVETDKGTVVRELARGVECVCFLGDDMGDLPAFAELARLRASGELTTLSVAVDGFETPREVIDAADTTVEGPRGALRLLSTLAGA
jgi:trehalose 6-phosphate phosphatase